MSAASAASSHIPLSTSCSTTGECACFFAGFGCVCALGLICVSLTRPSCGIPGPWWHTVLKVVRLAIVCGIFRHVLEVSVAITAPPNRREGGPIPPARVGG
eukprot:scaffold1401_cov330-Pavlova_lutheri.AAC.153